MKNLFRILIYINLSIFFCVSAFAQDNTPITKSYTLKIKEAFQEAVTVAKKNGDRKEVKRLKKIYKKVKKINKSLKKVEKKIAKRGDGKINKKLEKKRNKLMKRRDKMMAKAVKIISSVPPSSSAEQNPPPVPPSSTADQNLPPKICVTELNDALKNMHTVVSQPRGEGELNSGVPSWYKDSNNFCEGNTYVVGKGGKTIEDFPYKELLTVVNNMNNGFIEGRKNLLTASTNKCQDFKPDSGNMCSGVSDALNLVNKAHKNNAYYSTGQNILHLFQKFTQGYTSGSCVGDYSNFSSAKSEIANRIELMTKPKSGGGADCRGNSCMSLYAELQMVTKAKEYLETAKANGCF